MSRSSHSAPQPAVGSNIAYPPANAAHLNAATLSDGSQSAGLAYHRLSHADPSTRWFSPLLEGLLGVAVFIGLDLMISLALVAAVMGSGLSLQELATNRAVIMGYPPLFALTFLSLIAIIPSLFVARLVVGPKPWGLIHSVAGRLRASLLLPYLGLGFVIYGLYYAVILVTNGVSLPEYAYSQPSQVEFWVVILMALVLVPAQCYAEELAYRGFMMQAIGRWVRTPWLPILLPAALFMFSHDYDAWGLSFIFAMGACAGFLCWYTGGLEASISLHAANNVTLLVLSMVAGLDPFASAGVSPVDALQGISLQLLYVVLACLIFKVRARRGIVSREIQP